MSEVKKNAQTEHKEATGVALERATGREAVPETVVYVGPTIAGLASYGTIFNNGLPEGLKTAIEKMPAFRGLLVPLANLAKASKEIETKSGATYVLYTKVANYKP